MRGPYLPAPDRGSRQGDAVRIVARRSQVEAARTDPPAARQLLGLLTGGCRTLAAFEWERSYPYGAGVPYLAELGPDETLNGAS